MDTLTKDRKQIVTKSFRAEVKAEAPAEGATTGTFTAKVAAFGNVDLGGDRIEPAAFDATKAAWMESGDPVPVIWSHQWDDPMAHIGSVAPEDLSVEEDGLHVTGSIDLSTDLAKQVHRLMVARRVKEFSFAYIPTDAAPDPDDDNVRSLRGLDLIELGPTLKGMNPETELFGAKSATAPHDAGTSDESWDAAVHERNLPNSAAALIAAHAWRDPDGDPDAKATYKFIHHMVGEDGRVGAANLVASSSSIGVLNGGRGGSTIPRDDRAGVYGHVAKHLRDGDREPPELRAWDDLEDTAAEVEEEAEAHGDQPKTGSDPETKYGRVLSKANEGKLREAGTLINDVLASLPTSGDDEGPDKGADRSEGLKADSAAARLRLLKLGGPSHDGSGEGSHGVR